MGSRAEILAFRAEWETRCHFCGGPSFAWLTSDTTWAKVEPLLGQQQACFECFGAAWYLLGHNGGEPFSVAPAKCPSGFPGCNGECAHAAAGLADQRSGGGA